MKHLLAIISDENRMREATPEQMQENMRPGPPSRPSLIDSGADLGGEGLQPSDTATTVRRQGDDHLITDGPFAETKEQLGGYYPIDCKNLDEAIGWAKKLPVGDGAAVEVRPVMDYEAAGSTVAQPERGFGVVDIDSRERRSPVPAGIGTGGRNAHPRARRLRPRRGGRAGRVPWSHSRRGRSEASPRNPGPG